MKAFYSLILCCLLAYVSQAQQTLSVRINASNDDLEEYLPSTSQTKTVGAMDVGSSDLELGNEAAGNIDPQLVGLRFNNITIPKGAIITRAYLKFTVDATGKNTDPCNLFVYAQDADNPVTFDPTVNFNISSRARLKDSIAWNIAAATWKTVGESAADQTSSDISRLVQALVNRNGWVSGNSLALFIRGTGLREADAFDDAPTTAAQLVIEYLTPSVFSKRIAANDDDLEEYLPSADQTKTAGAMDAGSSDLELGNEAAGNKDPQLVGMRFTDIKVPAGSRILNAYIQFTTDATGKNTDPVNLHIYAQNNPNPETFNPNIPFNISSRPQIKDSVAWNIPAATWKTVGESGADQRSTNIASLVEKLIAQNGWVSGNAMAFFIKGTGLREADAFDDAPTTAAQLVIEYIPAVRSAYRIAENDDDLEEYLPSPDQTKTVGAMDTGSSDLELGNETAGNKDPQLVGLRFKNIDLPQNAVITNAYIQFTTDATGKNTDPSNLYVYAQDADNPVTFTPSVPFNISSRSQIKDSVAWNIPAATWKTVGESGADQRSTNIASLVQKLVNRTGWQKGNAMAFFIKGTGLREADAYDDAPTTAAQLVIEYLSSESGGPVIIPTNPITNFPIKSGATWNYFDKGTALGATWTSLNFNDTTWTFNRAPFGYGTKELLTTTSFGTDAANKFRTTYFRKKFEVKANDLLDTIQVALRADDGAVVYINGQEVTRVNMAAGAVVDTTLATKEVTYPDEFLYFVYDIPKTFLTVGTNVIAVEVHQNSKAGADVAFDLKLTNRTSKNAANLGCRDANDKHIGCFTSITALPKLDTITIPQQHAFQFLVSKGDPYSIKDTVPSNFDFTGYVPINNNSRQGYLSISHEREPIGGASVGNIRFDNETGLWKVDSIKPVDFSPVVKTIANCSGTVTPWGTVITSEEYLSDTLDTNRDGYIDAGWNVEFDPKTKTVVRGQKLWAMGRMSHENVVVNKDQKTAYQGEDSGTGCVYKFVANTEKDLSSGKLFVLKLTSVTTDTTIRLYKNFNSVGEPVGSVGTWVEVPNTTIAERNNVKAKATELGGTLFNGVEDVEISPIDGKIYFAVKGGPFARVYRFKDDGTTVSAFETFVGGTNYRINTGNKVIDEDWGDGNDNLTFDDRGNLWVLQDGSRDHVWIVRPEHTQASPKVETFMLTPSGSEPTGMTFTPDYRYMFISIQEPSGTLATNQKDVSGKTDKFNRSHALVVARKEYLGVKQSTSIAEITDKVKATAYPNPTNGETNVLLDLKEATTIQMSVFDLSGRLLESTQPVNLTMGQFRQTFNLQAAGIYFIRVNANGNSKVLRVVRL